MVNAVISEAPTLGPRLAEAVRLLTEFGERHKKRLERIREAYATYFKQSDSE